ncbi:MAG: hypothetical protein B7C24_10480 [Bacteroidetes bacterium 4572_77]|nr:MAG: hypothetical protein B7C24_10480 [Bacteroidetes bacterium 4572_77]
MKKLIITLGFFALKQASISASHFNKEVRKELNAWPDGFTLQLRITGNPSKISFMKQDNGLKSIANDKEKYDLTVVFKTEDIAYRIITTLSDVPRAFTQNRLSVYGDTADSMIRLLRDNKL